MPKLFRASRAKSYYLTIPAEFTRSQYFPFSEENKQAELLMFRYNSEKGKYEIIDIVKGREVVVGEMIIDIKYRGIYNNHDFSKGLIIIPRKEEKRK